MSQAEIEAKVKEIIVDKLGVDEAEVWSSRRLSKSPFPMTKLRRLVLLLTQSHTSRLTPKT